MGLSQHDQRVSYRNYLNRAMNHSLWLKICETKTCEKWRNINSLTASIYLLDVLVNVDIDNHWWNAKARTRYWIPFPGEFSNFFKNYFGSIVRPFRVNGSTRKTDLSSIRMLKSDRRNAKFIRYVRIRACI